VIQSPKGSFDCSQQIKIHSTNKNARSVPSYGRGGSIGDLAGRYQFSFELPWVGAVGAPDRTAGKVWVFEHGVHD